MSLEEFEATKIPAEEKSIFKTRNGESGNGNGNGNGMGMGNEERGTGNGESLKRGIFKSGNL